MKLSHLEACGFRGYRNLLRVTFGEGFTIIDGRNGVGKSTIFDAIEFALTGSLSRKYNGAKASGETVDDYLWWSGSSPAGKPGYVEVGFRTESGKLITLRRGEFEQPSQESLWCLTELLCDVSRGPVDPLTQLCASAIIRDEHITQLTGC